VRVMCDNRSSFIFFSVVCGCDLKGLIGVQLPMWLKESGGLRGQGR
jgi:hypothetical protein